MELIYTDKNHSDIGVLSDYSLDMAIGSDENNFELTIYDGTIINDKSIIYFEDTEYGGIIDELSHDTEKDDEIVYGGRTWIGIIDNKVIEPPQGMDYLDEYGDVNDIMRRVLATVNVGDLFTVEGQSGIVYTSRCRFDRYTTVYKGFQKMLKEKGYKLKIRYDGYHVVLSPEPIKNWSTNDEFDASQMNFKVKKMYRGVNHYILLGQGELAERTVVNLYANKNGEISESEQTFFGVDEITNVYENVNAESREDLIKEGTDNFNDVIARDTIEVSFDESDDIYGIGDIVGAYESITDSVVSQYITKKILKVSSDEISVNYEVGKK